ncbi:hypothetical protein FRC11_012321 [Ceratobasidium sp. 423]|nr:hypothetical protein FRC11_012321 [Ceratobasidium sp. 423]
MSTQFALDPELASNSTSSTDAAPPTTAAPSSLTKTPAKEAPAPNHNPNPPYYSILPALPPLPGWGPFPGPMFAPPGTVPMPVYMIPGPWHHDMNHPPPPMAVGLPPQSQPPVSAPAPASPPVTTAAPAQTQLQSQASPSAQPQSQAVPQSQPQKSQPQPQPQPKSHYPPDRAKPIPAQPGVKARPRRPEPPPINPAATASPHYQNPGGFGGIYTPPSHPQADPSPTPSHSHYAHKSHDTPSASSGDLGRPFACGLTGCSAAFDRKSDCERHRRTHAKGATESRPFRCSRPGCEAAFDRKDALMRHERNERTHLVRQTQPGRLKRPIRVPSKIDTNSVPPSPPRRVSTRKRKTVAPGVYLDPSESDFEDDDGEFAEGHTKRVKAGDSEEEGHDDGMGMDNQGHAGLGANMTLSAHSSRLENHPTSSNPGLSNASIDGGMEDMVVIPPDEQLVIDPQLRTDGNFDSPLRTNGFDDAQGTFTGTDDDFSNVGVGVETMQAVEAIQAALQQMEADKGHEAVV